jgi:hypothetical protein
VFQPLRRNVEEIEFSAPPPKKGKGKLEIQAPKASKSASVLGKIPPVEAGAFKPRAWQEWLEAMSIPRKILNRLWGTLALAGTLLLLGTALAGRSGAGREHPGQIPYQNVTLRLTGQACLQDSHSLTGLKLTFHLPEIPLDLQEDLGKLADHSERGDFVYEIGFSSQKVPNYCVVSASCTGYATTESREIPLTCNPLEASVPPILLSPARRGRR